MTGTRLRLNDDERAYLLRLIGKDTKLHQAMVGKPITKLIVKLSTPTEKEG